MLDIILTTERRLETGNVPISSLLAIFRPFPSPDANYYETDALAKRFGVSRQELERTFWDGVNIDYATLEATGAALQKHLASGRELHITHPNGTDLRMRITDRPSFVSDGVISDADVKMGGAACQVWLPAGEIFLPPSPVRLRGSSWSTATSSRTKRSPTSS